ncbi:MAG: hydroxymethylbilane synthase [Flavobacteriales bacterium]|nr:hydroxymethylbilane synthase [Flavobacteriales bacterium]
MQHVTIGTRGSDLALWQANYLKSLLEGVGCSVSLKIIKTKGDKIQHLSFDKIEGKGFFTKEIEEALLIGEVDVAVHSHKDLETENPAGLTIAAVPERADVRDVLLVRKDKFQSDRPFGLAPGAVVGTSSIRRKSQLLNLVSDIEIKDLRGNVPTRIAKMMDGNYDAIVLAHAGLLRLGLSPEGIEMVPFNVDQMIPAPAQGALAFQIRDADEALHRIFRQVADPQVELAVHVERTLLQRLQGGCHLPFGAHCLKDGDGFTLHLAYAAPGHTMRKVALRATRHSELIEQGWEWLQNET